MGRGTAGYVVTFTKQWTSRGRPLRISVLAERRRWDGTPWTADMIAAALVERACLLLHCKPRALILRPHPADGPIAARRPGERPWERRV